MSSFPFFQETRDPVAEHYSSEILHKPCGRIVGSLHDMGEDQGRERTATFEGEGRVRAPIGIVRSPACTHAPARGSWTRPPFRFNARNPLAGREAEYFGHLTRTFDGALSHQDACSEDPFDAERCKDGMLAALSGMRALKIFMRSEGTDPEMHKTAPFHIRPKSHMCHHLVLDSVHHWGSPDEFWCYRDESFAGTLKALAAASRHARTMENVVSEKVLLLGGLRAHAARARCRGDDQLSE